MLLRGGLVADGIGTAVQRADVLIEGPVIAAVGNIDVSPGECAVIDLAPGSVVCPGFIDAHVHAEGPLLADGRVAGALAQGVTTLVVGQDGESWIGATAPTARYLNRYFAPVNGALEPVRDFGVASFRDAVAGRLAQNVAVLASQGTIRHNVAGMAPGLLDGAGRAAARRQVEDALAEGAVGCPAGWTTCRASSGAARGAEVARPLAGADRPYVSHLRGYGPAVGAGLDELVAVGAGAGVRVHASHLWGEPTDIEAALTAADAAGVPVTYDMYSYRKSSTILAQLLLPPDVQAGGPDRTLAVLTDPGQRAALLKSEKLTDTYLRNVYLGTVPRDRDRADLLIGAGLALAAERSLEAVLPRIVELAVPGPSACPTLTTWIAPRLHCAGSDGIYQGQHPHPRLWRVAGLAGHYLGAGPETGTSSWPGTWPQRRKSTACAPGPDRRRDRRPCVIGEGGPAGHCYDRPRELATGVDHVFVNGVLVWPDPHAGAGQFPGQLVS
jgi:N-acyl-D-amino-acid deacylase